MNIRHYIRKTGTELAVLALVCLTLCGCESSFLFDGEGNCDEPQPGEVTYKVRFIYDYNMNYADAFAEQVSCVTLYVVDSSGNIVWQKTEDSEAVKEAGYEMQVDVAPGTYSLVAWCGERDKGSFSVNEGSLMTDLQCTMTRERTAEGSATSAVNLDRWFHGYLEAQNFPDTEGEHTYTVSLVKDTNIFHIVLRHESGAAVDADDYEFTITADNGLMDWDNSLLPDEDITYSPWDTYTEGATEPYDTRATTAGDGVADLTTARMVKGNEPWLTVTRRADGDVLFSRELTDYLLLIKGNYSQQMGDQEFLDREDEWEIVLLLDEENYWLPTVIYINSWRVVLQNTGL